jgi:hypothetical protein
VKNLGRVKAIEGGEICRNAAHGNETKENETYCGERREMGMSIWILCGVEFK